MGRSPEAKERARIHALERSRRPEERAKMAAYHREYMKRPEVQTRLKAYQRSYSKTPKGKRVLAETDMRCRFGIDFEDWARMYESQNRKCKICRDPIGLGKNTHIDHCHSTGIVRGLLCHWCNMALGNLRESPDRAQALIAYMTQYPVQAYTLGPRARRARNRA